MAASIRKVKRPSATRRDLWVGFKPNGIGEQKPNHYREMREPSGRTARNLPYAWRILRKGVCDGCALGVAGFHDWTHRRRAPVHDAARTCSQVNTMRRDRPRRCSPTSAPLRAARRRASCASSGRLAYPMVRRAGRAGLHARLAGTTALDLVAERIRATDARPARRST